MGNNPDLLVWIDLEMTGLDPERHTILEIATLVTDAELAPLAEGPVLAIRPTPQELEAMDGWSREHHGASGLLNRCLSSPHDLAQAEALTLTFLKEHGVVEGQSPLCGNSIWQDRRFIARYMTHLDQFLHYRLIDVSTLKELAKRWYPELQPPAKKKSHLALDDIRESLEELRFYRRAMLR
ncbi:MAG: oligoribonuclease [Alphaproteobacteria bacterium CG_4_10_14_0_2_um_filter_63_37]|nr:MAG: oligoribonuclease [Proteobacteria bacterium CG1_02_64_396]PJA24115.1 MAG: oligoribonuclease [Alphaproteobacteria bacterium CG_4_10_14_0_2_um_filter_63_37]